jgi:hypothetical protein
MLRLTPQSAWAYLISSRKFARTVVRGALLAALFVVAFVQVLEGVPLLLRKIGAGFSVPHFSALGLPHWTHDWLLQYGMFSPEENSAKANLETMGRRWGSGIFAVNSRTEIWVELKSGGFARLPSQQYFPDPRDEAILLRSKKLKGYALPMSLRNSGKSAEGVFGEEVLARHSLLNPRHPAIGVYVRTIWWPAGTTSQHQHYAGEQIVYAPSISDLERNAAWGKSEFRKIWPP